MMTLEQMRKRKRELGYSNVQLSNLTDIPLGTLNKILCGATKNPRKETLEAIQRVLEDTTYQYGYVSAAPYMVNETPAYAIDPDAPREKKPGEYTIDDYYELPDDQRVELINGKFYDMAAPTVVHQMIAGSVYAQFLAYIRRKKGKCLPLISPIDVKLDADNKTMVQPDVAVVCDRNRVTEKRVDGGPDFVLEVLSPSSVTKDAVLKASKYLEAGVKEYWIIDPEKERVVVFLFCETDFPEIYPLSGKLPVHIFDGNLEIDLDEYKEFLGE